MAIEMKKINGRVWIFGDEVDTGQIVPGRYVPLTNSEELATHVFEDVAPEFRSKVNPGDIIVAGRNFGCGSSREHAPKAIKGAGISAVVAESFARIFYRNALNVGLLVIAIPGIGRECAEGDVMTISLDQGRLVNETRGKTYSFTPYEDFIVNMLQAGGVINYTKQMLQQKED